WGEHQSCFLVPLLSWAILMQFSEYAPLGPSAQVAGRVLPIWQDVVLPLPGCVQTSVLQDEATLLSGHVQVRRHRDHKLRSRIGSVEDTGQQACQRGWLVEWFCRSHHIFLPLRGSGLF